NNGRFGDPDAARRLSALFRDRRGIPPADRVRAGARLESGDLARSGDRVRPVRDGRDRAGGLAGRGRRGGRADGGVVHVLEPIGDGGGICAASRTYAAVT